MLIAKRRARSRQIATKGSPREDVLLVLAAVAVCVPATTVALAAPPASLPDGPDLSLMALEPGDFDGGRVTKQRYTSPRGVRSASG